MDYLVKFLGLIDKIFNTNILEELSKIESIAQLVPWLAGIIMVNIPLAIIILLALKIIDKCKNG